MFNILNNSKIFIIILICSILISLSIIVSVELLRDRPPKETFAEKENTPLLNEDLHKWTETEYNENSIITIPTGYLKIDPDTKGDCFLNTNEKIRYIKPGEIYQVLDNSTLEIICYDKKVKVYNSS